MDYLARPKYPSTERARVALVGAKYDGGDFLTYPERAGECWKHVLHKEGQATFQWYEVNNPTDDRLLESFFQSWLFFGLLHELLDPHGLFDHDEYVGHDDEGLFVCLQAFPSHLRAWTVIVKTYDGHRRATLKERLVSCLSLAYTTLSALAVPSNSSHTSHQDFDRSIRESIICLAATITAAAEQCLNLRPSETWTNFELYSGFTELEKGIMKDNGWCPSIIAQEDASFNSVQYRYFIKNMTIPDVGVDHTSCTSDACIADTIDPERYKGLHTSSLCQCDMLQIPLEAVEQCLLEGSWPVITILGSSIDTLTVKVVPFEEGMKYMALSHVWADGLGNPLANALPRCQLSRLQSRISALAGDPSIWSESEGKSAVQLYFWIDTLLVPVQERPPLGSTMTSEELDIFRQEPGVARSIRLWTLAMAKMRDVYAQATFVLVLDRSLEAISVADVGIIEANIRLHSGQYPRRLWTFQEVALARRVVIQYQDQALALRDAQGYVKGIRANDPVLRDLATTVTARNGNMRSLIGLEDEGGPNLLGFHIAVRERKCSHADDEALCGATIMNLDLKTIASQQSHHGRMREFWNCMPDNPHGIPHNIVWNQLPRLSDVPGYHWAPSSFKQDLYMTNRMLINPDTCRKATLLPNVGLQIRTSGYRLRFGMGNPGRLTRLHALLLQSVRDGLLHLRLPGRRWATLVKVPHTLPGGRKSPWELFEAQPNREWYLVQNDDGIFAEEDSHYALLGYLETHQSGEKVFASQTLVTIKPLDSSWNAVMNAAEEHALTLQKSAHLAALNWVTFFDQLVGTVVRVLPAFIRSSITPFLAKYLLRWQELYMVRWAKQKAALQAAEAQSLPVQKALAAITGPRPGAFNMGGHICMNFLGFGAVIEEVFPSSHEWVIG